MNSQLKWKFVFIGAVLLFCIYVIIGRPDLPTSPTKVKDNLSHNIQLGLDLKGGSHLVLQVQLEEAIDHRCDSAVDGLNKALHDKNIGVTEIRRVDDTHILVRGVDPSASSSFSDLVNSQFPDWSSSTAAGEVNGFLLTLKPSVIDDIKK